MSQAKEEKILKLFHKIEIPMSQVKDAVMHFYDAFKDPTLNPEFKDMTDRICKLHNALSNLNTPILLNPRIVSSQWTPELYRTKMFEVTSDIKESIRNGFAVGCIKEFLQYNRLSEAWFFGKTDEIPEEEIDEKEDSFMDLAMLTGDIERISKGSKERIVGRRHAEVILPSTEKVLDELGDNCSALEFQDELEHQVIAGMSDQIPTLPDATNSTGYQPFDFEQLASNKIRPNHQPLVPSKVSREIDNILGKVEASETPVQQELKDLPPLGEKVLSEEPESQVSLENEDTQEQNGSMQYSIESCIAYLQSTLPDGVTITITGKKG